VILEEEMEIIPQFKMDASDELNKIIMAHLMDIRNQSKDSKCQTLNYNRIEEIIGTTFSEDIILLDIFKTELHLLSLWGENYQSQSFKVRYQEFL